MCVQSGRDSRNVRVTVSLEKGIHTTRVCVRIAVTPLRRMKNVLKECPPARSDRAPRSSCVFMVESCGWGKESNGTDTECGSDLSLIGTVPPFGNSLCVCLF